MVLLFDFYGQLLSPKQRSMFTQYYHDDLSLGEIANQAGVSRQAVYDVLKRSERALNDLEDKLGLVGKHLRQLNELVAIKNDLIALLGHGTSAPADELRQAIARIDSLLASESEDAGD